MDQAAVLGDGIRGSMTPDGLTVDPRLRRREAAGSGVQRLDEGERGRRRRLTKPAAMLGRGRRREAELDEGAAALGPKRPKGGEEKRRNEPVRELRSIPKPG